MKKSITKIVLLLNLFFIFFSFSNIKISYGADREPSTISGVPLKYVPIKQNYTKGVTIKPEYIIIHDTGNRGKGANAMANRNYFNTTTRPASTQFIVDDKGIVQALPTKSKAWHIGDGKQQTAASNGNSIGIELCVNSDGDFGTTFQNGIKLTRYLMKKYNIPPENVIRHYDATKKICPRIMIEDDPSLWTRLKKEISKKETPKPKPETVKPETPVVPVVPVVEEKKSTYKIPENYNGRVIVGDSDIKLQPTQNVENIDFVKQGSYINILEKVSENYCKISYNGGEGYIALENVMLFEDFKYNKNGKVEESFNLNKKLIQFFSFGLLY